MSGHGKRFILSKNTSESSNTAIDTSSLVIEKNFNDADGSSTDLRLKSVSDQRDTDDEEMILAVLWKNNKLGAAYFNMQSSEIFVLNEVCDAKPEHAMLANLYRQVQPAHIITEGRSPDTFLTCLTNLIKEDYSGTFDSNATQQNDQIVQSKLSFLPKKEYNFESCKLRIYSLQLPYEPENSSEKDHEIFLNSIINFNYNQTIHALGALLKYLDRNWSRLNMDNNSAISFLALHTISLNNILTMDNESYKALQIFNKLSHPSNFKKGTANSTKEGLSLFSILNRCQSKLGMQYLRVMLQNPTNDQNILENRYKTIAFCNKPENEDVVKNICSSLRQLKNVNGIMTKIKNLRGSVAEWKSLFNTIYNGVLICEFCEKYQNESPLFRELVSKNSQDLFNVAHNINRIVDFDVSKTEGRFTVKLGIDQELDRKRQVMSGLHSLMSSTAKCEIEKLPAFIEECTMVYLPNLGYLLGIKAWAKNLTREQKELPNLKFVFQNQDYIHYKSEGCEELDNLIGDTYPEILAHEMRIMMKLTKYILKHLHKLTAIVRLCMELDYLIALSKVCKENDYQKPILTTERMIDIKQGRHPLQEHCVDNYVPNDVKASDKSELVTILTGPNACGKSVYLKQVALIIYMAHIGCYVPAEYAKIPLLNNIHTRIQTVENAVTRMSAFLIDLRQMSSALQTPTARSLVIIDEFGKGTSEIDGLALLAACINNFLFYGSNSPFVFVSTHFHSLKQYLISSKHLKLQTFEHMMQEDELIFLYKLKDGNVESSFAHSIAEAIGIDTAIITRAKSIFRNITNDVPVERFNSQKQNMIMNNIKNAENLLKQQVITKEKISNLFKK